MLEKIGIRNFKSFKNDTEISFVKTNYSVLPQNLTDAGILKGAIFVGANASGKSNIILAIKLLLDFLFMERNVNSGLFKCMFSDDSRYSLSYHFLINGKHVEYTIDVDVLKNIICEHLSLDGKKMIERIGSSAISYIVDPAGISYDEKDVAKDTLFLRTLFFNTKFTSNPDLQALMAFLMNSVYVNAVENKIIHYGKQKLHLQEYIKEKGIGSINEFLSKYNFEETIDFTNSGNGLPASFLGNGGGAEDKLIFFKRKDIKEQIPFSEESLGNQNLIRILPAFFEVINNNGLLLIDEFSSGFHPILERMLVKYFMEKSKDSQLIFVSHSTGLLSNTIMRPDQEYSVEFNGNNGSSVHRFSDDQPRTAQNIEKMYMSGVFGGLPAIRVEKNAD